MTVKIARVPESKTVKNRVHLDVIVAPRTTTPAEYVVPGQYAPEQHS